MKSPAFLLPLLSFCTAASLLLPAGPLRAEAPAPPAAPALPAPSPPPAVTVGATAPSLAAGTFLQGEPVKTLEPGKVYLIDFWATWCAPCLTTIPRLNEFQKKYADRGLIIIGQAISEADSAVPAAFIKKLGDQFTYRAASDDTSDGGQGKMLSTWLQASRIPSIPTAFLVNKEGRIAWIGQPASLNEEVLESVLAGTQDLAGAAKVYEEQRQNDTKISTLLNRTRLEITAHAFEEAGEDIKTLEPLTAKSQPFLPPLLRLEVACHRPDLPLATELAKQFAGTYSKNAGMVVYACSQLIDAAKGDRPSLEAAELILTTQAATAAEAGKARDLNLVIQLARAKNGLQKKDEAVTLGKEALALAPEKSREGVKKMLEGVLPADTP